jgi:hypothetical protein
MKGTRNKLDFLGFRKVWNDIDNYIDWIKTVKREEKNPQSMYRKFNMDKNIFYNIYVIYTLGEEERSLPEAIQRLRVTESISPLNRYLDEKLRFAEYLTPEFSRVYDGGEPTMHFLIVYRFTFRKLSLKWFLWRVALIGGITWLGFKANWPDLIEWISNLI